VGHEFIPIEEQIKQNMEWFSNREKWISK